MDEYYIPHYLDAPKKYLIFTIDEVIAIALLFLIFVFVLNQNVVFLKGFFLDEKNLNDKDEEGQQPIPAHSFFSPPNSVER